MNTIIKRKSILTLTVFLSLAVTSCFSFASKKNTPADPVVVSAPRSIPAEKNETSDAVEFRKILMATDTHLTAIQDICQHLWVLAIRSANGIYSKEDRKILDQEFQQMLAEIGRIRKYARYKGIKLILQSPGKKKDYLCLNFKDHTLKVPRPVLSFRYLLHLDPSQKTNILYPAEAHHAIGLINNELEKIYEERGRILAVYNRVTFIIELKKKLHDLKLAVK